MRTRAEIGRSSQNKGKEAERQLAVWLRANGFPHAERRVRTGFRSGDHVSPDEGDILGTLGLVWQLKYVQSFQLTKCMADTAAQCEAARADYGILVHRRTGHADPGRWWAYVWAGDLLALALDRRSQFALAASHHDGEPWLSDPLLWMFPIQMELHELVPLLRAAGYGEAA